MKLSQLDTPCLVLDHGILSRNAQIMGRHIRSLGVTLRPHMKTAKSIDVANIALQGNPRCITVSTLKEAEYFASHGITDIIYAVSMVASKVDRAAPLLRDGVDLKFILNNIDSAQDIAKRASELKIEMTILIELDVGDCRGGMMADSAELLKLGRFLSETPGLKLGGLLCHAGNSYHYRTTQEMQKVAAVEHDAALFATQKLRTAGLDCPIVSIGSTPTAKHAGTLTGITEIRCGVYMFGDAFQAQIHSCTLRDMAVSVLATVICHRRDLNCMLIDAGSLALSQDRSTAADGLSEDVGFGLVMDEQAQSRYNGMRVARAYQEHGIVTCDGDFPFDEYPIGSRVRVFPNHACIMTAQYDDYQVVDGGDEIIHTWHRVNGW